MLRVLLDVDVILDVLARREPFFADSAAVMAACEHRQCRGLVAAHSLTTLHYLLRKHTDGKRAKASISTLVRILDVAAVDGRVVRRALELEAGDFEDAVQMAAAQAARADYVATRNVSDFAAGPVPALRPSELLPLIGV